MSYSVTGRIQPRQGIVPLRRLARVNGLHISPQRNAEPPKVIPKVPWVGISRINESVVLKVRSQDPERVLICPDMIENARNGLIVKIACETLKFGSKSQDERVIELLRCPLASLPPSSQCAVDTFEVVEPLGAV